MFAVGALSLMVTAPAQAEMGDEETLEPLDLASAIAPDRPTSLTVEDWVAQIEANTTVITDVQLQNTPEGLRIELIDATGGSRPFSTEASRVEGNALIIDIPNAVLDLVNEAAAEQFAPAAGIALVQLTNTASGGVRIAITGTDGPPTAEVSGTAGTLVLQVVPGLAQAEGADDAIQIVATDETEGYLVPNATTGSRTDTRLQDLPFSVQVVPQQLLEDRQVQSVNEALRTVVGVNPDNSSQSAFEGFTIRGFSGRNIIRNGLRDDTNITARIAIPNVERIEVLRGPAGALFSQGGPGGTVNIVTKRPLSDPHYILEGTVGNFGTFAGSLDLTGPLNESESLLYRFIAGASTTDTFIDFFDRQNYLIAPSLTWQISPATRLTLEGEYTISQQPNDRGLPARGTVLPNVNGRLPRDRFIGEPDNDLDSNDRYALRLGYVLDHEFSPNWQLQNAFRISFLRTPQNSLFPSALLDDERTLERGLFSTSDQSQDNWAIDTSVVGNFQTGSIAHRLLIGFDFNRDVYTASSRQFTLEPIDIFDPVYGRSRRELVATFPEEPLITNSFGVYLQDQITLLPQLNLLLGGRFDVVNQETEFADGSESFQEDEAFSPRVGLVYQPSEDHSIYASYSRSFLQSVGTAFDDSLFRPERGTQYEIGIKSDWLDQRLSTTLAFYDITRSNVLTTDPDNPNFSIQTGEQRSRGLELIATGEILPGWNIVAGYAYTDAEITEDNDLEVGNRLNNVPENAFSLWTTYEIQSGDLQGLGFGLGLFHVGERQGNLENTFQVPSYTRTDAALFYNRDNFRIGINIENLFDIRYFEASESELRVFYGAPFTIRGTVSWRF